MVKIMLDILMNSIKEASLLIDYLDNAIIEDDKEHIAWLSNRARKKVDELIVDYEYIIKEIGLIDKVKGGDMIAEALHSHLLYQLNELVNKVNKI